MKFPDEWLAYDKVPKDLNDMCETRNCNRKERQKNWRKTIWDSEKVGIRTDLLFSRQHFLV